MPIRMSKDENNTNNQGPPGRSKGLGNLLPLLLGLFIRYPKIFILVIILGGIFYWFGGSQNGIMKQAAASLLATGCNFDQKEYDKAEVFEPLALNDKNPLPEHFSLEKYCPKRLNQGEQGSCVAWASAYACRTILEAQKEASNPDEVAFSPSFLYNQIGLDGCQGSYIIRAMEKMKEDGLIPLDKFPYSDQDCSRQPTSEQKALAQRYTMSGFNRLTLDGDDYKIDLNAIRQNVSQGAPVVIGMMVGGSFMHSMVGKKVWIPEDQDYQMNNFGGHAMCIIGYDDYLEGGAFQLMNSWGNDWGIDGLAWVRYKDFQFFGKEAYGVYPMGTKGIEENTIFSMGIALVNNETNKRMEVFKTAEQLFKLVEPINKNTKFKIEVENSLACYTYIFGEESDGSSYVLFPYTSKHSPYCGITGTRLFPKDYSLSPDSLSNHDHIVILVTKKPIDFNRLNLDINNNRGKNYMEKVNLTIKDQSIKQVKFIDGDQVKFETKSDDTQNMVAVFFEIDVVNK